MNRSLAPTRFAVLLALALLPVLPAMAHDGETHESAPEVVVQPGVATGSPFPLDLDTDFALVNAGGEPVENADYAGDYMLVFFGFARCHGICPTAYQAMGGAADLLAEEGKAVRTLLITIDPANEPPEVLAAELPKLHARLEGLTGSEEAITRVMEGFQVEAVYRGENALYGVPNYTHGSFIYLLGPESELLSVLPPILAAEQIARIAGSYIKP